MSDLTSIEKLKLETFLEMGEGYVLDFTNRTFQEFILENTKIDIYDEKYYYHSGSKANRLRAFWKIESNLITAKLLGYFSEYWKTTKLLSGRLMTVQEEQLSSEIDSIIERLSGTLIDESKKQKKDSFVLTQAKLLRAFDDFSMMSGAQAKRKRGLLLETLLKDIFTLYEIPTSKGFRRNEGGEQIDAAFKLEGWHYLVECKWTEKLTDIRQLDSLYGKINRSGRQTLGLFLSINGWSRNVCPLLKQNNDKSIILMDGYDLRSVLVELNNINLKDLLLKKIEYLNFEGEPFYSVSGLLRIHQ